MASNGNPFGTESNGQVVQPSTAIPLVNGLDNNAEPVQAGPVTEAEDAAQLESRRQSQLRNQHRFTRTEVIIPPENFAYVEDGLYRSVSASPHL
jgi:hypothetical protein